MTFSRTSDEQPHSIIETRVPDLDGLRGVAIFMVLVCHYAFAPEISKAGPSSGQVFGFHIFASGVELFFVLSGFLIGGILVDRRNSPHYFRVFYGRRTLRILPAYFGFLLVTGAAGIILHSYGKPTPVFDAGTPFWMFAVFLQNFSIAWYGDWGWTTVAVCWSLALEEQLYLTLPIAVRTLSQRTLVGASALLIAAAPVLRYALNETPRTIGTLVLSAIRADALAAGFLCAVLVRSRVAVPRAVLRAAAVGLAGLVPALHVAVFRCHFLRGTAILALYSCVLLLAIRGEIRILRSSVLRFLGTVSFTLYLVHQSTLLFLHSAVRGRVPSAVGAEAAVTSIAALFVAILIAWLSWSYFENPLVSWARRKFRY